MLCTRLSAWPGRSVMSGWVGQRECAQCGFAGPETEFLWAALDGDEVVILRPGDAGELRGVVVCCGCAARYVATSPVLARLAVGSLLAEAS
jgi:hypothetical protein